MKGAPWWGAPCCEPICQGWRPPGYLSRTDTGSPLLRNLPGTSYKTLMCGTSYEPTRYGGHQVRLRAGGSLDLTSHHAPGHLQEGLPPTTAPPDMEAGLAQVTPRAGGRSPYRLFTRVTHSALHV